MPGFCGAQWLWRCTHRIGVTAEAAAAMNAEVAVIEAAEVLVVISVAARVDCGGSFRGGPPGGFGGGPPGGFGGGRSMLDTNGNGTIDQEELDRMPSFVRDMMATRGIELKAGMTVDDMRNTMRASFSRSRDTNDSQNNPLNGSTGNSECDAGKTRLKTLRHEAKASVDRNAAAGLCRKSILISTVNWGWTNGCWRDEQTWISLMNLTLTTMDF